MKRALSVRRYYSFKNVFAGLLLFLAAVAAALLANSPLASYYHTFLDWTVSLDIGGWNALSHHGAPLTMKMFINDGLMTLFFLMVGLEIKRELMVGELSSIRKASLPIIAACGGMLFPVLIYTLICPDGTPGNRGLAIPMATDIAFSLGVLSLLGKRVPLSLKVFLTAFAVVDDIGGILVIALFYSTHVELLYLLTAMAIYVLLYFLGRRMQRQGLFVIGGIVTWYLFMQSGVHSTISGVLLAFVVPAKPQMNVGIYIERIRHLIATFPTFSKSEEHKKSEIVLTNRQIAKLKRVEDASDNVISPLQMMENGLHHVVNYLVLPLFAFANAGVVLGGGDEAMGVVAMAVMCGLIVGKFVGIFGFTWLAIKLRIAPMGSGMTWSNLAGVSLLGGIGFTVSLFIGELSFGQTDPALLNQAKFGILCGSLLAGLLGYFVLKMVLRENREPKY
jgi:NhaA family Na+:H+ antiporter